MFKECLFACSLSISFNKFAILVYAVITITLLSSNLCIDPVHSTETQPHSLEVKIYYEALCPYSGRFIRQQFYEAMIEREFLKYTDLKLIPYGNIIIMKDSQTGQEYLLCQHGLNECELNALHACIVENNNKMEQLQLIDCLMGGFTIEYCSEDLKINVGDTLNCKSSRSIDDILRKYGQETKAAGILNVPFIELDGTFDPQSQEIFRADFVSAFCEKYKQKYNLTLENCS